MWLLMTWLQRQLCASPHVCTMTQQLFLLHGTQARQPLQGPVGTFLVWLADSWQAGKASSELD